MAVASSTTLPGQPPSGVSRLVVLNGNGFTAPKQMYEVQSILAGDVSGGTSINTIVMDPRFVNLILRMELTHLGASTAEEYQLSQTLEQSGITSSVVGLTVVNTASDFDPCSAYWDPPGLLPITSIEATLANVDGDSNILTAWIYCFDKNALNTVPLPLILRAIGRTSGQTPPL